MKIIKSKNGTFLLGAYVPLTMEGNIDVDDVLASCYADIDHGMSHFGMTPMRWFPKMIHWIFGEDSGIQSYANVANHVANWVLSHVP